VWTAVPLYSAAGVTITRGHEPDGSWPRPTRVDCEINNDSLNYDPSRPESTLYGVGGRNTKTRVTVDGNQRVWAEASSWQPDRTPEHVPGANKGRSWTRLVAEGVLGRIGTWTDPLRSPLYRIVEVSGVTPTEWWAMEEDSGATAAPSSVGGAPMRPVGSVRYTLPDGSPLTPGGTPDFAGGSGVTGSAPLPSFQGGGTLNAVVRSGTFNGYAIDWVMQHKAGTDAGGTTSADVFSWRESGTYVHYTVNVIKGYVTVFHANEADDATLSSTGSAVAALDVYDGAAHHFRYQVRQNGGNYLAQLYIDGTLYATADNFVPGMAGTVGRPKSVEWNPGEDRGDYMPVAAGHVIVWASGQIGAQPPVFNALNGYSGEAAGTRFLRLCAELGITRYIIGTSTDTALMGPQRPATFLELLKEIRDTDDCRIDDERFDIALTMRTRRAMYSQTAALTLTYPAQVAIPFTKLIDTVGAQNRVTVKNASGGEVTASLLSGRMSVQPPPAGIGEKKGGVDVSVANQSTQLPDFATWHLAKGTIERPRYAEVTVDLLANPSLVSATMAVREGDMIAVTGAEPETVRFLVDGIVERIGAVEWTVTFQVELYDVWIIGVYDDGVWRWDTRTTTLAAGATSTATSLSLTTADANDVLTTAAGSLPYDLMIEGERVRVTAITAPAGTGPYTQTATVTRSINGVVKAQLSGGRVNVYDSRRWGL
jgi:hypothetical protein